MNGVWIGATDEKEEGKWIWSDGEEESFYTNWHRESGEPNGARFQNCALILADWQGSWDDGACTWVASFICERRKRGGDLQ